MPLQYNKPSSIQQEGMTLVVPRSRLASSERAFSVAAPRAWNNLPVDIRLITDTKLFKEKLKAYLFNLAYPTNIPVIVSG